MASRWPHHYCALPQPKHGMLGTTFGGNHLACAAALAVLEVMEQEKLMDNAKEVGDYLMAALKRYRSPEYPGQGADDRLRCA